VTDGDSDLEQAALIGQGDGLIHVLAIAEMVAQFVVGGAEAGRCRERAEAAHRVIALFDAAMVLFHPVVHIAAGPMLHVRAERLADGARVGVVPVCRHLLGSVADDRTRLL